MLDSSQSTGVLRDGDASASCGAKRRIQWVDYGKGFAMLLVFWGHTICPDTARDVLYAFHMPLFYFLSGYVFSIRKYADFKSFVWRKFRTLIVPGAFFGAVCLIGDALNSMLMGEHGAGTLVSRAIGLFVELRGGDYYVIPWFFASLFIIEIAVYLILRHGTVKPMWIITFGAFASLIGYGYAVLIGHIVPWSLETSCSGLLFFEMGYLLRTVGIRVPRRLFSVGMGGGVVHRHYGVHLAERQVWWNQAGYLCKPLWLVSVLSDCCSERRDDEYMPDAGARKNAMCAGACCAAVCRQEFVDFLLLQSACIANRFGNPSETWSVHWSAKCCPAMLRLGDCRFGLCAVCSTG